MQPSLDDLEQCNAHALLFVSISDRLFHISLSLFVVIELSSKNDILTCNFTLTIFAQVKFFFLIYEEKSRRDVIFNRRTAVKMNSIDAVVYQNMFACYSHETVQMVLCSVYRHLWVEGSCIFDVCIVLLHRSFYYKSHTVPMKSNRHQLRKYLKETFVRT